MKNVNFGEKVLEADEFIEQMRAYRSRKAVIRKASFISISFLIGITLTVAQAHNNKLYASEKSKAQTVEIKKVTATNVQAVKSTQLAKSVQSVQKVEVKKVLSQPSIYNHNIPMPKAHQEYLYKLCNERGLDYRKMLAIIGHESEYNSQCITDRDYGYFQVNQCNHADLAKELKTANAPLDAYVNLNWGTYMMKNIYAHWSKSGHTGRDLDELAWSEYNEGVSGLKKWGLANKYIRKVDEQKCFVDSVFNQTK